MTAKRTLPPDLVDDPDRDKVSKRIKVSFDTFAGEPGKLRKSLANFQIQRAYKCKLNGVIRDGVSPAFRTVINNLVNDMSQLAVMASDLLNIHFLRLLSQGQDVPVLKQQLYREALCLCMNNIPTNTGPKVSQALVETFDDHFPCPGVEVVKYGNATYNSQVVSCLARDMATNANTMICMTLKKRTLRVLRLHCGFGGAKVAKVATSFVFGDDTDIELGLADEAMAVILAMEHKERLGLALDCVADSEWVKDATNYQAIMRYLHWIQCEINDTFGRWGCGKNFCLLPQSSIRRKMIEIDNDGFFLNVVPAARYIDPSLTGLFAKIGKVNNTSKGDDTFRNQYWSQAFNFRGVLRAKEKGWSFNFTIRTDGCAVSVYQWRWMVDREYRRRTQDEDGTLELMNLWDYQRGLFATGELMSNDVPDDVAIIAIDPGNTDLMTALDPASGESWSLGKKQHQAESGVRDAVLKQAYWQKRDPAIQQALNELCEAPSVGPDPLAYQHYVAVKMMYWPTLWGEYGDTKYSNLSFKKYRRRLKSLDSFIQKLLKDRDVTRTVVAFGAGRWPTTRKGEITGPLVGLARRLSIYVKTVYTQERYTSKRCYDCHQDLTSPRMDTTRKVMKGGRCVGYKHSVASTDGTWGLKQCLNTDCESYGCLVNRDWNACWNISEVFLEWMKERRHPLYLRRNPLAA